ncbi:unnamed protein product [Tenebrio molitor]|nr:unnamed protein product [Tenebrio molitor]
MHSLLQKFLCKQDNCIRSFSSISDLRKHLDKNHSELSVTQPNLEAVFENHALASTSRCSNCLPRTQKNKDESTVDPPDAHLWANFKSKKYNLLSLLFILDFQPFRVVEDTGFQQFVSALNPAYALPSGQTKSKIITPAMYEECLHKMKEIVETGRKFCVTTDCWTSINTTILHSLSNYIGVTAHFLNDNFELHSILLEYSAMHVSHTSENLAAELHRIGELKKKSCSRNQTMHIIFKMHFRYN